jgi:hypothetical protein
MPQDEMLPALLTPTERLVLEAIRDTGSSGPGGDAWAASKGFMERRKGGLTDAGLKALVDDEDARREALGRQ